MQRQGWSAIPNVARKNLLVPWDRTVGISCHLLPKWLSSFHLHWYWHSPNSCARSWNHQHGNKDGRTLELTRKLCARVEACRHWWFCNHVYPHTATQYPNHSEIDHKDSKTASVQMYQCYVSCWELFQLMQSHVARISLHCDSEFLGEGQQGLGVWRQVVQSRRFYWRYGLQCVVTFLDLGLQYELILAPRPETDVLHLPFNIDAFW